jgi:hypothetical protein
MDGLVYPEYLDAQLLRLTAVTASKETITAVIIAGIRDYLHRNVLDHGFYIFPDRIHKLSPSYA